MLIPAKHLYENYNDCMVARYFEDHFECERGTYFVFDRRVESINDVIVVFFELNSLEDYQSYLVLVFPDGSLCLFPQFKSLYAYF